MSARIQRPKLPIVEGRDEEVFFQAALANHLGLTDIQVMPIGGKTLLTPNLEVLVNDARQQRSGRPGHHRHRRQE
jgi:hypothetical protein